MDSPTTDDDAEAEGLYRLLGREVIPTFYQRDERGLPARWLAMMRASIRHTAAQFSARRMVMDYFTDCYAPAARRVEQLRRLPHGGGQRSLRCAGRGARLPHRPPLSGGRPEPRCKGCPHSGLGRRLETPGRRTQTLVRTTFLPAASSSSRPDRSQTLAAGAG